jgi:hypothetical protein
MLSRFHCATCGSEVAYRSRPRNMTERFLLPVLLLRPVRCGGCYRRKYVFVLTEVHERSTVPDHHHQRRAA